MSVFKDISLAPKDGEDVILFHPSYETLPIASWADTGLELENGDPAYAWVCQDTNFQAYPTANAGFIWEDEQMAPTHWIDIELDDDYVL